METKKRFLITTSDESTWRFDVPVLFLGEWCRLFDRKEIWSSMDAIVVMPYGVGEEQKKSDLQYLRDLEINLFPIVVDRINQFHGTNHSIDFWKILIGPWFRRYLEVVYNRIKTIEQCLELYTINATILYEEQGSSLATNDLASFIKSCNEDVWNNILFGKILLYFDKRIEFENTIIINKDLIKNQITKKSFLQYLKGVLKKATSFFVKNTDAVIINSYLPIKEEIKLQLCLKQVPQFWQFPKIKVNNKFNKLTRKSISFLDTRESQSCNLVEKILLNLIFDLIPIIYLEGFYDLKRTVMELNLPLKPEFIFTSNNFSTDEVFKYWAGIQVENKTPYFVGQHGNNYGTSIYLNNSIEETTAFKFLTWGWVGKQKNKYLPAFVLTLANKNIIKCNPNGGIALVEIHSSQRLTSWDDTFEHIIYFEDQKKFVRLLNQNIRKQLFIRLHSTSKILKWSDKARWNEFDPNIKLYDDFQTFSKIISTNRLIIFSYDSTGLLENLHFNIPTMAFWQNGLSHIIDEVKPDYQLLIDVGIIHLNAESIANKVNETWDNISTWWNSEKLQSARLKFCSKYAKHNENPVKNLKNILKTQYN